MQPIASPAEKAAPANVYDVVEVPADANAMPARFENNRHCNLCFAEMRIFFFGVCFVLADILLILYS
jgi:hypothetical protein